MFSRVEMKTSQIDRMNQQEKKCELYTILSSSLNSWNDFASFVTFFTNYLMRMRNNCE